VNTRQRNRSRHRVSTHSRRVSTRHRLVVSIRPVSLRRRRRNTDRLGNRRRDNHRRTCLRDNHRHTARRPGSRRVSTHHRPVVSTRPGNLRRRRRNTHHRNRRDNRRRTGLRDNHRHTARRPGSRRVNTRHRLVVSTRPANLPGNRHSTGRRQVRPASIRLGRPARIRGSRHPGTVSRPNLDVRNRATRIRRGDRPISDLSVVPKRARAAPMTSRARGTKSTIHACAHRPPRVGRSGRSSVARASRQTRNATATSGNAKASTAACRVSRVKG
jgi:hypothetical protein